MNLYKATGKKIEGWPQWVARLVEENTKLRRKVRELEKELMELRAKGYE